MIIKRFNACGDAEVADAKEPQPRYAWRRCRSPARQSRLGSRRGYGWRSNTANTRAWIGRSGLAHCGGLRPRESRGRGRGCHAARGEEGRVPAAPSLVPARVRGLKVGGRARQGQARGCGGAGRCGGLRPRARRPAGAAATLHVAWKTPGRRPLRGLLWAGVQRPRGAGSPRRGRARTTEAIARPSAACGGHGSASETRRDQRGTGRRFRYGQKSATFLAFQAHLFLGSGLCPRVLDHRTFKNLSLISAARRRWPWPARAHSGFKS